MRKNVVLLTLLSCLVMCFPSIAKGKNAPTEDDDYGLTPLHHAVVKGDEELVKSLLKEGADVDSKDNTGRTALHIATSAGYIDIVKLLIAQGGRISIKDNAGRTPLHYAAGAGSYYGVGGDQTGIVQLLLDKGAEINVTDKQDWTPLHCATYAFRKATVELLIGSGADLDAEDRRGRTAFSLARGVPALYRGLSSERGVAQLSSEIADLLRKDGSVYHVATCGKDSHGGTSQRPFRTLSAAIKVSEPGDTIFVHSGTYNCLDTIHIDRSGEPGKPIRLRAYSAERPVIDFSMAKDDGLVVTGAYWHIKGLSITNAAYFGIRLKTKKAHHNILEQITAHSNNFVGVALLNGAESNFILNCDSYRNFDPLNNGESADGLCAARSIGESNIFIGCRAWENSDDGFDFWYAGNSVRLERCYAWRNGENIWNHPFFTGNGNGFKLGQKEGRHILINCIAWGHPTSGFDSNANNEGIVLRNCTGWDNKFSNYCFKWGGRTPWEEMVLRNNISYGSSNSINPRVDSQHNTWDSDLTLTDSDFLSFDDSVMTAPRNPDGSIPENNFLKLSPDSKAIDKGVDVNMPYTGKAPDLGAFEHSPASKQPYVKMLHQYVRDHDVTKIKELLDKGEDINGKDWLGYAPLHWACYFGYADLVTLLIDKGANPNLISDTGRTPLVIAKSMDYEQIRQLLRKYGAKK